MWCANIGSPKLSINFHLLSVAHLDVTYKPFKVNMKNYLRVKVKSAVPAFLVCKKITKALLCSDSCVCWGPISEVQESTVYRLLDPFLLYLIEL